MMSSEGQSTTLTITQRFLGAGFLLYSVLFNPLSLAYAVSRKFLHDQYAFYVVLILSLTAFFIGVYLLRSNMKTAGRRILAMGFSVVFMLFLVELGLRGFYAAANVFAKPKRYVTADLGWATTGGLDIEYSKPGFGEVHYSTTGNGFRIWSVDEDKLRVLVVGDSYTQATQVSDGEAYYDVITSMSPDVAVSAYGCGGYGSLQEYLVLDRWIDEVKPDLVLWQFSDNDFINNDFERECNSASDNNHMVRPYFVDGEVVRMFPAKRFQTLQRYSYVIRHLAIVASVVTASEEESNEADSPDLGFDRAVETTNSVMKLVRQRVGSVPILAIAAYKDSPPQHLQNAFKAICRQNDIQFLQEATDRLEAAKVAGRSVTGGEFDPHWNKAGHQIVGKVVNARIAKLFGPQDGDLE